MKNPLKLFASLVIFFFSIQGIHAQSQADTAKVKPKYEYAILIFRNELVDRSWGTSTHKYFLDIEYQDGKKENMMSKKTNADTMGNYDPEIFKAFDYLGAKHYELITSYVPLDRSSVRYIFRREKK